MKIMVAMLLSLVLCSYAAKAEEPPIKTFESDWVTQSELDSEYKRANDNRYFPYHILGKIDANGAITYKGHFMPYPPALDHYYAYWGMNTRWYEARKTALETDF